VFGCKHANQDKFFMFGLDQSSLKFTPFNFFGGEFGPLGKEKYITLQNVYKNTPEVLIKKNFDFKALSFQQSLDNPRRIIGVHLPSCIFDLKMEDTGVCGYTDTDIQLGKAIGLV